MIEKVIICTLTTCLLLLTVGAVGAKECSRAVTAEMRANALANVERFEWAAARQKAAIAAAERWASKTDDELWEMITSQELPRDIHTNKEVGCPNCGQDIAPYGNYPWKAVDEWKLQCPNCNEIYPKNDFQAFYNSALDEHGYFHRELGDQSLLFNAEHPDPNDPLHKLYVDDSYGLTDEKGNRHRFVAYYNSWNRWADIRRAVGDLATAYTLTSDPLYAHKAAVMVDRIADVYPDMNWGVFRKLGFEQSDGGSGRGRIQGSIWEVSDANINANAYDVIFDGIQDDAELVTFLSAKAAQYNLGDKSSIEAICRHIEDDLLLEILESTRDGRISPNLGGRKVCVVNTAAALDRPGVSEEWIDWCFSEEFVDGYSLTWLLTEGIDSDGMGGECGSYGLGWTYRMVSFPGLLAKYPDYTKHDLVAEFPKLKQCFLIEPRLLCLDSVFPPYGDSGSTGAWSRLGSATRFALGYKLYGDPRMAALAWRYAGGEPERLRMADDIFAQNPDELADAIAQAAIAGEFKLQCEHLGRYGQVILQTEEPDPVTGRAIWMVFGHGLGHRHADALNLGLYAKNIDMLPDLGYPEYTGAWPKRFAWTANTISHNTLLINDSRNAANNGGQITLFSCEPPVRLTEVSAPAAYDDVDTYRRTVALVDISASDSYVLDVFRARGGTNHRLSYHGPAQTATVDGLSLIAQPTGTFAGPDVEFTELAGEGETIRSTSGFSYLYDVERSGGPVSSYYTVDWRAEDTRNRIPEGSEPHLRLHALTPADEVALASGDPPQNKSGNPRRLRYLIQSRLGEDMSSQFVTVLEPYDTTPFISAVRALDATHDADPETVVAVAVEMADGTVDILISCEQRTSVQVEGGIEFNGRFGMIRLVDGQVRTMRMSEATLLTYGGIRLETDQAAYEGIVTAISADDPADHRIVLDPPLPQNDSLVGQRIHFENEVAQDTTYEIAAVTPDGISTGEMTIIHGFNDRTNFSAGLKYLVNPGDRYVIPNHVGLDR